jgi:hypothetical protein
MRLRAGGLGLVLSVVMAIPGASAGGRKDVEEYLRSLEGKAFWLKADVLRLQYLLNSKDVTNVHPDGTVSYRAHLSGFHSTITTDVSEFTRDVNRAAIQQNVDMSVRVFNQGTRVTVKKASADDEEAKLEVAEAGGTKAGIILKFEKGGYGVDDVKRSVGSILADSQADLFGQTQTVNLELGMTVDKVISLKGKPKTQAVLGRKTVLTYDDVKLVFENDKLVDVQ